MRRLATENDLEQVFAIYMHAEVIPFLGRTPLSMENFRFIYEDLLGSKCFFVYEVSDHIVGFYKASRHSGRARHIAYLSNVALNPSMQGHGIGRAMMDDAIARLNVAGVKRIELLVESDNPHAIGFYKKLGFECGKTVYRAYRRESDERYIDELAMSLEFD